MKMNTNIYQIIVMILFEHAAVIARMNGRKSAQNGMSDDFMPSEIGNESEIISLNLTQKFDGRKPSAAKN